MELSLISAERNEARKAFLAYRRAVRDRHDAEDEQIMRGYRALAQGHQLIDLPATIRAGGTTTATFPHRGGGGTIRVPRLAAIRADARLAYTSGITREGALTITADRRERDLHTSNRRDRLTLPDGTFEPDETTTWTWRSMRAIVPNVPPPLRPHHHLRGYTILWEAEWAPEPRPPVDPALLKHIGGALYAVVAIWNLTDLERAVLAARA